MKETFGIDMNEVLSDYIARSKQGKKLNRDNEKLKEAREILSMLSLTDELKDTKEKVKLIITKLYTGHNFDNQIGYLNAKRKPIDVIAQAYSIILSKEQTYEKSYKKMIDELEN